MLKMRYLSDQDVSSQTLNVQQSKPLTYLTLTLLYSKPFFSSSIYIINLWCTVEETNIIYLYLAK